MAQKTTTLDWLSIGEAAKYLGVSRDTLRRWGKRGKIKSYRTPGGRRRYTIYDLELAMKPPKTVSLVAPKPPEPKPEPKRERTASRSIQLKRLRIPLTLTLGLILILILLAILPAVRNLLLTYLKGPSGLLKPVPGIL